MVVRDSAGVTIIESLEGSWGAGEGWSLSEEPVVSIGRADGPGEYSLYRVRTAMLMPDRRILVANGGTDQLRYFDSSGTYLYSVGRDGFGPGEFKRMYWVWLVRDSVVVFDYGQDRVSVFSAAGEFGRTLMLDRTARPTIIGIGGFSDGSILGAQDVFGTQGISGTGFGFRLQRLEKVYRRYSPDGEVLDSLGVFFGGELYGETSNIGPGMSRAVAAEAPFGRTPSTIVFGQQLYYASSEAYEIKVFNEAGKLERIIRRPIPNRPVTARDIAAFKEYFVEGSQADSWERRRVNDLTYPETMPAYGSVTVDKLGNVWVAEYSLGREDRSGRWTVFDADGRMLGVVEIPRGGVLTDIGEDYLMGRWRNDLDVEQVRMYRLFRN